MRVDLVLPGGWEDLLEEWRCSALLALPVRWSLSVFGYSGTNP